jgi:uncharacterized C2H2 Zn-finger protein
VSDLIPGYTLAGPGQRGYRGVLRRTPKSRPSWTCRHDDHLAPRSAKKCAAAERERREQGKGEVFTLLHCRRCAEASASAWWDDVPGEESLACPRCGVPLRRMKLVVVGGDPAVDQGNGKH